MRELYGNIEGKLLAQYVCYLFVLPYLNWLSHLTTNMQLLSEEIFDFSRGEMTQQKIKDLKGSLNRYRFLSPFANLDCSFVSFIVYCFDGIFLWPVCIVI